MTVNAPTPSPTAQLLQYRSQLILHQAIAAVAKFGVADLLERGIHATSALAQELGLNEDALYRTLRALAAQGIFEETSPRSFRNTPLSNPLRSDAPRSLHLQWLRILCPAIPGICLQPSDRHRLPPHALRHGLLLISPAESRTRQNFRRRHDRLH